MGVIASGGINKCDGNTILTIPRSVDVGRLGFKVMTDTNIVVIGKEVDELRVRKFSLFAVQHLKLCSLWIFL